MSIESAWRGGKIDRPSYEALRNAVLAESLTLATSRENSSAASTEHDAIFPSWSLPSGAVNAREEIRADRGRGDQDSTHLRTGGGPAEGKIETAFDSKATDLRSDRPSVPSGSFGQITNPSQWPFGPPKTAGPGSILKERFVLEEVIGCGGVGTIYRARDLRKEEAQDRHPFVAVKVLNEDFRKHPEALKALQRESRKAQALAQPNVASVFDAAVSISPEAINAELEYIQLSDAERYPIIRTQLAEAFARRVTELQSTSPQRADSLLMVGRQVFPGSAQIEGMQPVGERTEVVSAQRTPAVTPPSATTDVLAVKPE